MMLGVGSMQDDVEVGFGAYSCVVLHNPLHRVLHNPLHHNIVNPAIK